MARSLLGSVASFVRMFGSLMMCYLGKTEADQHPVPGPRGLVKDCSLAFTSEHLNCPWGFCPLPRSEALSLPAPLSPDAELLCVFGFHLADYYH